VEKPASKIIKGRGQLSIGLENYQKLWAMPEVMNRNALARIRCGQKIQAFVDLKFRPAVVKASGASILSFKYSTAASSPCLSASLFSIRKLSCAKQSDRDEGTILILRSFFNFLYSFALFVLFAPLR
jgi:hypothetical protein